MRAWVLLLGAFLFRPRLFARRSRCNPQLPFSFFFHYLGLSKQLVCYNGSPTFSRRRQSSTRICDAGPEARQVTAGLQLARIQAPRVRSCATSLRHLQPLTLVATQAPRSVPTQRLCPKTLGLDIYMLPVQQRKQLQNSTLRLPRGRRRQPKAADKPDRGRLSAKMRNVGDTQKPFKGRKREPKGSLCLPLLATTRGRERSAGRKREDRTRRPLVMRIIPFTGSTFVLGYVTAS